MIPVIMRNQQTVNIRHVADGIGGGSRKGPRAERYGRGKGAEHGIDKKAAAAKLNQKRRMPEPYESVAGSLPSLQVHAARGNGSGRDGPVFLHEKGTEKRKGKAAVAAQNRPGNHIMEHAVRIVRRSKDPRQFRALRQSAELGVLEEAPGPSSDASGQKGSPCRQLEKSSSVHSLLYKEDRSVFYGFMP